MPEQSDRHGPIRTCIGCRQRRPQADLLRCVLDAEGAVQISRTASGRGAWLCGPACVELARRKKAFERAWRTSVHQATIDGLTVNMNV